MLSPSIKLKQESREEEKGRTYLRFCLIERRFCVGISANSIERNTMLWTIVVILIVLWLLGFIGHFGGGLIHLLLVIVVVIVIINLIQGRRGL